MYLIRSYMDVLFILVIQTYRVLQERYSLVV